MKKMTDALMSKYAVLHDTRKLTFDESVEQAMEEYAKPYIESVVMIGKICLSKKHKDPISDILCECNRAVRLANAAAQFPKQSKLSDHEFIDSGACIHCGKTGQELGLTE